jgi:co-chaperonin GroES (HSP10)
MGRIISGTTMGGKTPVLQIREKGRVFVGLKVGQKPGKKGGFIFEAKIEEGTTADTVMSTGEKDQAGKNVYAPCDVDLGDVVSIFGDTQLNDKLSQVAEGERFKLTSNGKLQNPKSGNYYNDYTLEVL